MRFSQRTDWNTEESELAQAHRLRIAARLPIADLTASNPTRCGFLIDLDLLAPLTDPQALDYDPQPRGLLPARQAVCAYYADHGIAFSFVCSAIRERRSSSPNRAIRSLTFWRLWMT